MDTCEAAVDARVRAYGDADRLQAPTLARVGAAAKQRLEQLRSRLTAGVPDEAAHLLASMQAPRDPGVAAHALRLFADASHSRADALYRTAECMQATLQVPTAGRHHVLPLGMGPTKWSAYVAERARTLNETIVSDCNGQPVVAHPVDSAAAVLARCSQGPSSAAGITATPSVRR